MSVNINNGSGSSITIPEELGRFKVNVLENGVNVAANVRQLWAKTTASATEATLVWDATPVPPQPTDIPTDLPADTCGICQPNTQVYYPFVTKIGTNWNCNTWKATGRFDNINTSSFTTVAEVSFPQSGGYKIYNTIPSSPEFSPPPPGYILGELSTYSIKDRVALILRRQLEAVNGILYAIERTPDDPFKDICFKACGSSANACYTSGPQPAAGGAAPPCTTEIGNIAGNTVPRIFPENILFDSGCISTSGAVDSRCITACYGVPNNMTSGGYNYTCRAVQSILPHFKGNMIPDPNGIYQGLWPDYAIYAELTGLIPEKLLSYQDFTLIMESGCETGENSAWVFRAFLPIYVTLPNYKNKYIEITRTNFGQGAINPSDSILLELEAVAFGRRKAAQYAIAIHPDTGEKYWGHIGYPKEFTHTHVVMVEVTNPVANNCGACLNQATGTDNINPSFIRFYPITKTDGSFSEPFKAYMTEQVPTTGTTTLYGVYGNTTSPINPISVAVPDPKFGIELYGTFYIDSANGKTTTAPLGLTYQKFYDRYRQPTVSSGPQGFDCNCGISI